MAALDIGESEYLRLSHVERFADGSGYSSRISVRAGEFACHDHAFVFDDLPGFVEQLRALQKTLAGSVELRTPYEQEFVSFRFDARGHVHVTGLLKEYPGCSLHFELQADQTFVPPFIEGLERVIREMR